MKNGAERVMNTLQAPESELYEIGLKALFQQGV